MNLHLKAISGGLLKLGVSAFLIFLVIQKIDIFTAFEEAKRVTLLVFMVVVLLLVFQLMIAAFRWILIVHAIGHRLPYVVGIKFIFVGSFFSQILPSVGGDIVRVLLSRRYGLPMSAALSSVVLERGVSVLGVVLVIIASFPLLNELIVGRVAFWPMISAFAAIVVTGTMIIKISTLPARWAEWRIFRMAYHFANDMRQLFALHKKLLLLFFLVVLAQANLALATFILARALDLPVTLLGCALLMPPVALVASLPISIGGWGVREGVMVIAFSSMGVQAESALALSVLLAFAGIMASLPGSLVWMRHKSRVGSVHNINN